LLVATTAEDHYPDWVDEIRRAADGAFVTTNMSAQEFDKSERRLNLLRMITLWPLE
jgi:hypothetical protein